MFCFTPEGPFSPGTACRHCSLPHIQVAIDEIAKVRPEVRGMAPANLIETCFLDEIDAELR